MVKLLIDGLTTQTDALVAAKLGANGLGFILDEDNPRYIEFTLAHSIIHQLAPMVAPYITPHRFEPEILSELAVKLRAGSLIIPAVHYSKDLQALPCPITVKGSQDEISVLCSKSDRKLHGIVTDLPLSAIPDWTERDRHHWKKLNQEHHLLLPCDVEPDALLDAMATFQPAALYFQGASESHTGLQDWPKVQAYVQAIQQIVERV